MERASAYRQALAPRTAVLLSIGLIVARWSVKVASNIRSLDTPAERVGSVQQLARSALASGAFTVAAVTLLLWLSRETYLGLGFRRQNVLRQVGIGAGLGSRRHPTDRHRGRATSGSVRPGSVGGI